jgi:hypothetical protein
MSTATIKSADKIKLLDQMLEDLAGDEFDEYDVADSSMHPSAKQYSEIEELDIIDSMH